MPSSGIWEPYRSGLPNSRTRRVERGRRPQGRSHCRARGLTPASLQRIQVSRAIGRRRSPRLRGIARQDSSSSACTARPCSAAHGLSDISLRYLGACARAGAPRGGGGRGGGARTRAQIGPCRRRSFTRCTDTTAIGSPNARCGIFGRDWGNSTRAAPQGPEDRENTFSYPPAAAGVLLAFIRR